MRKSQNGKEGENRSRGKVRKTHQWEPGCAKTYTPNILSRITQVAMPDSLL
jgi:hypothetical protein